MNIYLVDGDDTLSNYTDETVVCYAFRVLGFNAETFKKMVSPYPDISLRSLIDDEKTPGVLQKMSEVLGFTTPPRDITRYPTREEAAHLNLQRFILSVGDLVLQYNVNGDWWIGNVRDELPTLNDVQDYFAFQHTAPLSKSVKDAICPLPFYSSENNHLFINDERFIRTVEIDGTLVKTAPLAFGRDIDLIAVTHTPQLIESGYHDQADELTPDIRLRALYFLIGSEIHEYVFKTPSEVLFEARGGESLIPHLRILSSELIEVGGYTIIYLIQGQVNIETGHLCLDAKVLHCDDVRLVGYQFHHPALAD